MILSKISCVSWTANADHPSALTLRIQKLARHRSISLIFRWRLEEWLSDATYIPTSNSGIIEWEWYLTATILQICFQTARCPVGEVTLALLLTTQISHCSTDKSWDVYITLWPRPSFDLPLFPKYIPKHSVVHITFSRSHAFHQAYSSAPVLALHPCICLASCPSWVEGSSRMYVLWLFHRNKGSNISLGIRLFSDLMTLDRCASFCDNAGFPVFGMYFLSVCGRWYSTWSAELRVGFWSGLAFCCWIFCTNGFGFDWN